METRAQKIYQRGSNKTFIKIIPGHFATNHSHINYYIDMTTVKIRQNEAQNVASLIASHYSYSNVIDTIICMDGCEVIGAYLADELKNAGIMSLNTHQTIYVITPEFNTDGQIIFRDNIQIAVRNKHILLLLASATTGKTIARSLECIRYYNGHIAGISAIFSAVDEIEGQPIHSIFNQQELPNYQTFPPVDCPMCQAGQKIEAIVNSYGYSAL